MQRRLRIWWNIGNAYFVFITCIKKEIKKKNENENRKYDYEEHFTETRDHYVLCIHRIPQGRKNTKIDCIIESGTTIVNHINDFKKPTNHNGKPVVLLYHGLTLTSEVWVSNIKHRRNLALYLSDQGYDVWMGNARGNKYSQSHLTKDPKDADFWQFSINEFAMIDMPDTIDVNFKKIYIYIYKYVCFVYLYIYSIY